MTEPSIADVVLQALHDHGLFVFDEEALAELAAFYAQPQALMTEPNLLVIDQARALSHLNAAEFALIPMLARPDEARLPPQAIVRVGLVPARLGLLKGDCSLIIWTHAQSAGAGLGSLSASDVAVFSGDVSKSARLRPELTFETAQTADLTDLVAGLDLVHQQSHWPPARRVAEVGLLPLQGLLWTLKRAVVAPDAVHSIPAYVESFVSAVA